MRSNQPNKSTLKTPDYSSYSDRPIKNLLVHSLGLEVQYCNGEQSFHLASDLREFSTDEETTHPITREALISPLEIPDNFKIKKAILLDCGSVRVTWSHQITSKDIGHSIFDAGWLYQTGLLDDLDFPMNLEAQEWDAKDFDKIPICDGTVVMEDAGEFIKLLTNLIRYGVVIIKNLPIEKEVLQRLTSKIGTIRSSNFGTFFDVKTSKQPDSNAYTSGELLVHNDLSTREYIPGLQFLHCLENETDGGLSTLTDGFALAKYFRHKEPSVYKFLSNYPVNFASKGKSSDYRLKRSIFRHNEHGEIYEIRWTCWLRSPLRGSLEDMDGFYRAQKKFYHLANNSKFKVKFRLEPGDMICMDNRRILHGRTGFTENSGNRWIRGCYMDRDELWSALRVYSRIHNT
ncbi:MAG: TauD/TfdA family dioxygenase [Woeseiaceae bacterium]|nr:TauD/TfdA family dioxygenase [Woeseiaceae bacterium]